MVKTWKWLKLLNSVPFSNKTLVNRVCIRIWSFYWLSQVYNEWRQSSKLVNFQDFWKGLGMWFRSKFDNDWNSLILFHSSRNHEAIMFTIEFDHSDWLSKFYSVWKQISKISQLSRSLLRSGSKVQDHC